MNFHDAFLKGFRVQPSHIREIVTGDHDLFGEQGVRAWIAIWRGASAEVEKRRSGIWPSWMDGVHSGEGWRVGADPREALRVDPLAERSSHKSPPGLSACHSSGKARRTQTLKERQSLMWTCQFDEERFRKGDG
jgi:hypothetical protein